MRLVRLTPAGKIKFEARLQEVCERFNPNREGTAANIRNIFSLVSRAASEEYESAPKEEKDKLDKDWNKYCGCIRADLENLPAFQIGDFRFTGGSKSTDLEVRLRKRFPKLSSLANVVKPDNVQSKILGSFCVAFAIRLLQGEDWTFADEVGKIDFGKLYRPFNFEIYRERAAGSYRRPWVFEKVDSLIDAPKQNSPILLSAPLGFGKTFAFTNWYLERGDIDAVHYFDYGNSASTRSREFVLSIADQLCRARVAGYENYLAPIILDVLATESEVGILFRELVVNPLRACMADSEKRVIIAVDALDEAQRAVNTLGAEGADSATEPRSRTKVDVLKLCHVARDLPKSVRFVATTRPDRELADFPQAPIVPEAGGEPNKEEFTDYLRSQLKDAVPRLTDEELSERAARLAKDFDQIFLGLDFMIVGGPSESPKAPGEMYATQFKRRFSTERFRDALYEPLSVLVAAGEPLPDALLAKVCARQGARVRVAETTAALELLEGLVDKDDRGRRLFRHVTLRDWIQESTHVYTVSAEDGRAQLSDWIAAEVGRKPKAGTVFMQCCLLHPYPWTLDDVVQMLAETYEREQVEAFMSLLCDIGLVDIVKSADGQDHVGYRILDVARQQGIALMLEQPPEVRNAAQKANDELVLRNWTSRDLDEILQQPQEELESVMDRYQDGLASLSDEKRAVVLFQRMMGGRLYTLSQSFTIDWLKSPHSARVHVIASKGMLNYISGDYVAALRSAREAFSLSQSKGALPWVAGVARASRTLLELITDQVIDHETEFRQAFDELNDASNGDTRTRKYWLAVAYMEAGTGYWHLMRKSAPTLGAEMKHGPTRELLMNAISHYESALEVFEGIDDRVFRIFTLNSLGHLYRLKQPRERGPVLNTTESCRAYRAARELSRRTNNERGLLSYLHAVSGWLGWMQRSEDYKLMMSRVETLYAMQRHVMVVPIRAEYYQLWDEAGLSKAEVNEIPNKFEWDRRDKGGNSLLKDSLNLADTFAAELWDRS